MQPEEQRGKRPRYTVVPRTLIFLTREEQLLLLKGAPTKQLWAGKYNGLGGHIEPGETPYRAALREVREEAGLDVRDLMLRGIIHITMPEPPGIMLFIFTGTLTQGKLIASEEGEPTWVDRDVLASLPLVDDLVELLPRILELGPCLFGEYHFTEAGLVTTFEAGAPLTPEEDGEA